MDKVADYWIVAGKFVPNTRRYDHFYVKPELSDGLYENRILGESTVLSREQVISLIEEEKTFCIGNYEKLKDAYSFNGYIRVYNNERKKRKILYHTPSGVIYDIMSILPWRVPEINSNNY